MNKTSVGSRFVLWVGLSMLASGMTMAQISALPSGPAAPTNLNASAVSSTEIKLTWRDDSARDQPRGTVYKIERCTGAGCTNFAEITQVGVGRLIATYNNSGLIPNTTYSYRVRAASRLLQSAYTGIAQAATHPPSGPDLVVHFAPSLAACSYEQHETCMTACPYLTIPIYIKNQGDVFPSGQVSFTIKNKDQVVLHSWTVPMPTAGETKKIGWYKTFPWRCPGDPTQVNPPPNFFFTVDAQNTLAEGNEQNNTTGKWFNHPELTTFGQN